MLKKNNTLRHIVKNIKIKNHFKYDAKDFCKYYMEAKQDIQQLEYNTLLVVHSLEKGMGSKELRPFGKQKVVELIDILKQYPRDIDVLSNTPYKMGISILIQWKKLFEENGWKTDDVYTLVDNYLREKGNSDLLVDVGAFELTEENQYRGFNYLDAISTRHSIREFAKRSLAEDDIEYCVKAAMQSPSACNRQMCKVYWVKDANKKELLQKTIMGLGGFEQEGTSFFLITYDIGAFSFYGERNQGNFNAGLFAMNFVNAMHFRGIGSCFLQWGNTAKEDRMIRSELNIPESERIAVVVAAGYYPKKCMALKSCRKNSKEILGVI